MEIKPSTFENTWRVGAFGPFLCSQAVVPGMLARKAGVILFTGATAGIKPFPTSAAFETGEVRAARARASDGPRPGAQGIHVAYINVDGPIDMPAIHQMRPTSSRRHARPSAIAETYWHLAHRHRSAWTQELDVRPFKEKF